MVAIFRNLAFLVCIFAGTVSLFAQGSWVQVPTALQSYPDIHVQVGGLWGIVMADTGNGFAAGYASVPGGFSGVLRKTTGDPTWYVLPASSFSGLPANHNLWSAVSVAGTTVWVGGSNGRLYKSTDNGNTWFAAVNGMTGNNTIYDLFFKNSYEGMAVGSGGKLYYSSNGGDTWVPQVLPATVSASVDLYAVHNAGQYWYVCGDSHTMIKGSPQTSSTAWTDVTASLPGNLGIIEGLQFLSDNIGTVAGSNATGSPIYRTVDGSATFSSIGTGLPPGTYDAVHFLDLTNGWVGNAQPALYHTTNGGSTWSQSVITPLPSQFLSHRLTQISFADTRTGYASGGASGTSSTGWVLRYVPPAVPDITSTSGALDFGDFACDNYVEKQFTILNTGLGALEITAINFSHPEFSSPPSIPTPVPPNGGATLTVRWTPTQPGPAPSGARMIIVSNDPLQPVWEVNLSGVFMTGTLSLPSPVSVQAACVHDSIDIVVSAALSGNIQPHIINFENVSGAKGLRLLSPSIGSVINTSQPFTFRYAATAPGPWSGTYQLTYGDPHCPKNITIVFNGTANSATLTASPSLVDFGEVCVGKYKDMVVTLSSTGTVGAVVSSRLLIGGTDAFPNQHFAPFGPVPPNESRQYTVRFAPTRADVGLIEGVYSLRIDPCGDSVILVLRGIAVKPEITFTPTNLLALGPSPIGHVTEEQVQITNSGNSSLMLDSISLKPAHTRLILTDVPGLPLRLDPLQSVVVTAKFMPDRIETIISKLVVQYSGPCTDSARLSVTASSASPPTISVQASFDMGENLCNSALIDTLQVRNLGPGALTLSRFSFTGRNAAHFRVLSPATPVVIAARDSIPVVISCAAPVAGKSEGTLIIEHDDPKTFNSSAVDVYSERILMGWQIEGDSTSVMTACVHVGTSRTFSIRNTGDRDRVVTQLAFTEGGNVFQVQSDPLPMLIPAGSGRSFEVSFLPSGILAFKAVLEITTEPCDETIALRLYGKGSKSEIAFSPSPVQFPATIVASSSSAVVRVDNPSSAAVTVTDIAFQPPMPGSGYFAFESLPTLPFIIDPGRGIDLNLRFLPTAVVAYNAALCLVVSTPCPDTLCVSLRGDGVSYGLGLSRSAIDFSFDPCTFGDNCDTVDLINNGSVSVTITEAAFDAAGWFVLSEPAAFPVQLQPGTKKQLVLCARSDFTGLRSSTLRIISDDAISPELRLRVTSERDSSGILLSGSKLDFGAIAHCEMGNTKTILLVNSGSMVEIIDTLKGSAHFFVDEPLPLVLQPQQQKTISISFSPASYGIFIDTLFLTSIRCDRRAELVLQGEYHRDNTSVRPDPLRFDEIPVGSTSIQSLSFTNIHLTKVRVADILIQPSGQFASWGAYPKTVLRGDTIALPIQYAPRSAGQHEATACIILDQPCADTLCVELRGSTDAGELSASPEEIQFGVIAQCEQNIFRDTIRNLSNSEVRLLSSRIEGGASAYFELLNGITTVETLPPFGERIFEIRILPAAAPDGPMSTELVIENSGSSVRFTIAVSAVRVTLEAATGGIVDFGDVFTGVSETRSVVLRNSGSAVLQYEAVNMPPEISLTPTPPFRIDVGDSIVVSVTLTPTLSGRYSATLRFDVSDPCRDSTEFNLTARASDGLSAEAFDFGIVPSCLQVQKDFILRNAQKAEIDIVRCTVTGVDSSVFRILQPVSLPHTIAAGDSLNMVLAFSSEAEMRLYEGKILLVSRTAGIERTSTIAVTAVSHNGRLSAPHATSFPITEIGKGGTIERFVFVNNVPFAVSISNPIIPDTSFRILQSSPLLPAILQPEDSVVFMVQFLPDTIGNYESLLQFDNDAPCHLTNELILRGQADDLRMPLIVTLPELEGAPGDIVDIPVFINRDVEGRVHSWQGEISFNPSMLYPLNVLVEGTLAANMQLRYQYDQIEGRLRLDCDGSRLLSGIGPIAIIRCLVLIGNDTQTSLRIESDFSFGGAVRVGRGEDGSFTLIEYCDADGMRMVHDRADTRIISALPNPFDASLTIVFEARSSGKTDLRLYDLTGREIVQLYSAFTEAGRQSITFPIIDIKAGVYYCVLRHDNGADVIRIVKMR